MNKDLHYFQGDAEGSPSGLIDYRAILSRFENILGEARMAVWRWDPEADKGL